MCDILAQGQLSLDLPNLSLGAVDVILDLLPVQEQQKKTSTYILHWPLLIATGYHTETRRD